MSNKMVKMGYYCSTIFCAALLLEEKVVKVSRIFEIYQKEKSKDSSKLYLFGSGKFYIFVDKDAEYIASITTLKLTNLSKEVVKCGFPKESLDKYLKIFNNLNVAVEIFNEKEAKDVTLQVIKKLSNIDINSITPLESLNILQELKDLVNE